MKYIGLIHFKGHTNTLMWFKKMLFAIMASTNIYNVTYLIRFYNVKKIKKRLEIRTSLGWCCCTPMDSSIN